MLTDKETTTAPVDSTLSFTEYSQANSERKLAHHSFEPSDS